MRVWVGPTQPVVIIFDAELAEVSGLCLSRVLSMTNLFDETSFFRSC